MHFLHIVYIVGTWAATPPHEVLGIARDASVVEVRRAHRAIVVAEFEGVTRGDPAAIHRTALANDARDKALKPRPVNPDFRHITFAAMNAYGIIRRAFGTVPSNLSSTLDRFSNDHQVRALRLLIGRFGREARPLIETCLDFDTAARVAKLQNWLDCDARLKDPT